ncbi:MAG: acireductone synthase [bacterium]|nr:acireductone synthase [bacterium]
MLDIEGTTTPITFVYDVLFPFAAQRLEACCARADDDPRTAEAVARLRDEYDADSDESLPPFGDGSPYAQHLMRVDRKSTGLKSLQGIIWEEGYADGSLRAVVFDDVPGALVAWRDAGLRLRIFSSGSVLAQKLLFGHTEVGDLTSLFEGYHDTTTGPKKVAESYREIACAFELEPGEVLFLSDVVAELDAAAETGMRTGLLRRPGNPPCEPGRHTTHADFRELLV